jgi:hypothetical protein
MKMTCCTDLIDPATEAETNTFALTLYVVNAALVAVMICEPPVLGAVYKPVASMVPTVLLPPATVSTDHVTPVLLVPSTAAVNCAVAEGATVVLCGVTVILITVIVALALFVGSPALVAVTVNVPAAAGAVYEPVVPMLPLVELSSDHVTAVLVVLLTVAVNCWFVLTAIVAAVGAMLIVTAGWVETGLTVTDALADFVESAPAMAVTVTPSDAGVDGAVYKPAGEMVPNCAFPPAMLFTCHCTAVFVEPVTAAVNCCVVPAVTVAIDGDTVTATPGEVVTGFTVTIALADLVESATDTAVTVTVIATAVAGAVYIPLPVIVPTCAFPPATLLTCHCTAVLEAPVTVAWNCSVAPATTVDEGAEIATDTEVVPPPPPLLLLCEPPPQATKSRRRLITKEACKAEVKWRDIGPSVSAETYGQRR